MNQDIKSSREILLAALGGAIRHNQTATDLFDERMSEFLGINRTDSRCLDIIERSGRVSAGQLANESGLTTGAVTAVIDRLEAAGYAQRVRDPQDRRKVWVELTQEVCDLSGQIYGFYQTVGPMMGARFTEADLRAIVTFLDMSTIINQYFADSLREHGLGAGGQSGMAERAANTRRAMDAMVPALQANLDKISY